MGADELVREVTADQPVAAAPRAGENQLRAFDLVELLETVEAEGRVSWLVEGLRPEDAYGVLGAEDKAGKTWAIDDLAVSVASGTPWLGRFRCPVAGPVLMLHGEGGKRNLVRRLEAIARSKGLHLADLAGSIRAVIAVPRLRREADLAQIRSELERHPSRLVTCDPLYLAAAGARGSDLYEMGEALGGIQRLCEDAGAALVLATNWNKHGDGAGAKRFTGVGPGAWGRVLASAAVERRVTDPDGASNVLLRWQFTGSEIADTTFRMRRRVRAEDPLDLRSRLVYEVEVTEDGPEWGETQALSRSQERVLAALEGTSKGSPASVRDIGDRLAADGLGPPLKVRTIQKSLAALAGLGLVDGERDGNGVAGRWWAS